MILHKSTSYWATGITLTWHPDISADYQGARTSSWSGKLDFFDDGWRGDDNPDEGRVATEGTLRTRYAVADGQQQTALAAVIDTLIADAQRLGIQLGTEADGPRLYVPGDGEWADHPFPDDWRNLLAAEAQRIGWKTYEAVGRQR